TLENWIRRQLSDPVLTLDGVRKCCALGLVHYKSGVRTEVQTVKLGGREWDAKQLADLFNGLADECAAGIAPDESGSGFEQFEVVSFFSDVPDLIVGRTPINRRTNLMKDLSSVASEPPDAKGLTRQDMRHKEGWMSFILDATARLNSAMLSTIDQLSK